MSLDLKERLSQAWLRCQFGAYQSALEVLIYGNNQEEMAPRCMNPSISDPNWSEFLKKAQLDTLEEFIVAGKTNHFLFGDKQDPDNISLLIETEKDFPVSMVYVAANGISIYATIKQDNNGRFQIDDAAIQEIPSNGDVLTYSVETEDINNQRAYLDLFLNVLSQAANFVLHGDNDSDLKAQTVKWFKDLKPVKDEIIRQMHIEQAQAINFEPVSPP